MSDPFEHKTYHLKHPNPKIQTSEKPHITNFPISRGEARCAVAKGICPVPGFFVLKKGNSMRETIQLRNLPHPSVRLKNNFGAREAENPLSPNRQLGFSGKRHRLHRLPARQIPRRKAVPVKMP